MATFTQESERKFKLLAFNGYKPNGQKRTKAKRITVPESIPKRGVLQYVQAAADAFEKEFKHGYSEDANSKFEVFAAKWLARQLRYKPSTVATYRGALNICNEFIGGIKLKDLRPMTIEYLAEMLRKREWRGRPITERTVKKYLEAVGTVLEDARRNDIISGNPVRRVRLPHFEKARQFIPSTAEMGRLIRCILQEPPVYRLYFLLAIATGCRRGELCALRWGDVQGNLLRVSKSRARVTGLGVIETDTKNHRTRYVPLFPNIEDLLLEYFYDLCSNICDGDGNLIRMGSPPEPNDHIFALEGNPPQPDSFSRRLRTIYQKNGFAAAYHLHTMRHFYASYLLSNGISNKVTADILGHGDTAFLEKTYGHAMPEYNQIAANCIGSLFGANLTFVPDGPEYNAEWEEDESLLTANVG
ncbi:MAG: tyrosine-type recombinase/integrase [Oscillospiraceae bacterium]